VSIPTPIRAALEGLYQEFPLTDKGSVRRTERRSATTNPSHQDPLCASHLKADLVLATLVLQDWWLRLASGVVDVERALTQLNSRCPIALLQQQRRSVALLRWRPRDWLAGTSPRTHVVINLACLFGERCFVNRCLQAEARVLETLLYGLQAASSWGDRSRASRRGPLHVRLQCCSQMHSWGDRRCASRQRSLHA